MPRLRRTGTRHPLRSFRARVATARVLSRGVPQGITDKIGHAQDYEAARKMVPMLAKLIRSLLAKLDLDHTTVIMTSDHGNLEDLSVRNHTLNPVPTIVWGRHRASFAARIRSLTDITPAIVDALAKGSVDGQSG